jgi:hypothetical protein
MCGGLGQVNEIFVDNAANAMQGAINTVNFRKLS